MSPEAQLEHLLRQHKFTLVSQNKHLKFQNPEGKIYIMSKTPSDWQAVKNMVTTLKRVIASPVPTSFVVEEERQRKTLEAEIAVGAQRKATVGMQGAGKKAKSNGTGFTYIDKPVQFITEAQKELDRIATEWVKFTHRLKKERRTLEHKLAAAFQFAQLLVSVAVSRSVAASLIVKAKQERNAEVLAILRKKDGRKFLVGQHILWLEGLSLMRRPGEQLFEYWQTDTEPKLEVSFTRPPTQPITCQTLFVKDAPFNYEVIMKQTLHTAVTLWEKSCQRSDDDWFLQQEALPLLPHVRRALQTMLEEKALVAAMQSGFSEDDFDFEAFLKDLVSRQPKQSRLIFINAAD
jgi:hypothetical protein